MHYTPPQNIHSICSSLKTLSSQLQYIPTDDIQIMYILQQLHQKAFEHNSPDDQKYKQMVSTRLFELCAPIYKQFEFNIPNNMMFTTNALIWLCISELSYDDGNILKKDELSYTSLQTKICDYLKENNLLCTDNLLYCTLHELMESLKVLMFHWKSLEYSDELKMYVLFKKQSLALYKHVSYIF